MPGDAESHGDRAAGHLRDGGADSRADSAPYTAAHEITPIASLRSLAPRARARSRRLRHHCPPASSRSSKSCRSPRRSSRPASKPIPTSCSSSSRSPAAANARRRFRSACSRRCATCKVTTPDGEQHSLLDEVDLISAVSGGAFTAAYYALNRQGSFRQLRAALPQSRHREGSVAQGARAGRTGRASPSRS